jgi:V/A-type H+-transporting ATPase subunit A
MVGTVSPAGGNLEEPVTQCTLGIVKTFLALSSERAYKRFYPAIDPLLSWSRYSEQLRPWLDGHLGAWWTEAVVRTRALLKHGDQAGQMMQVTGEEGISIGDYVLWQKAMLVDLVYLQQNARDPVDASTPLERQAETFALLQGALSMQYTFANNDEARDFFTRLAHEFRNWNYIARDSSAYAQQKHVIERLIASAGQ